MFTIHVGTTDGLQVGESSTKPKPGDEVLTERGWCRVVFVIGDKIVVEGRPPYDGEFNRPRDRQGWNRDAW